MNTRRLTVAAAILLVLGASASAHRLDEYLQATIISVEKDRVQALMRLVPGVAVASFVLTSIDTNADGVISETERRAYAERVLRDVSLTIDGEILSPRLISVEFPAVERMKEGLGEIRIEFSADLPRSGPNRRLIFENHHHSRIAAYLVNCLVPRDRDIRVVTQNRNEQQSFYQLDYVQAGVSSDTPPLRWWQGARGWLAMAALLLFARLAFLWRQRRHSPRIGTSGVPPVSLGLSTTCRLTGKVRSTQSLCLFRNLHGRCRKRDRDSSRRGRRWRSKGGEYIGKDERRPFRFEGDHLIIDVRRGNNAGFTLRDGVEYIVREMVRVR